MKKSSFSHSTLIGLILLLEYMVGESHLIKDCFQNEFDVFILMNIRIFGKTRVFQKIFFVNHPLIGGNIPISIAMSVIIFDLL